MDSGPFSAVIAECQEVGRHKVAPARRQQRATLSLGTDEEVCVDVFACTFALLSRGVSSLSDDPGELCLLASV